MALSLLDFFFLKEIVANGTVFALRFLGTEATLDGLLIITESVHFMIISSCTGIVSFSIFAALIHTTEKIKRNRKILYTAAAAPIFIVWNIARLAISLNTDASISLELHDFLWIVSTFLILGMYWAVLKKEKIELKFSKNKKK